MGRPDDDVDRLRVRRDHGRQGVDGQLVALARAEEAEAQDDVATLELDRRLDRVGVDEGQIRDAVRDHVEAARIDAVATREQAGRRRRHDDGRRRRIDEFGQDVALPVGRRLEDRVERHDGRDVEGPDEVQDVRPVLAAPDAVFMLDRNDVDAAREGLGGGAVVVAFIATEQVVDFDGIRAASLRRDESDDLRLPTDDARSWVKAAMPQRRGG